MIHKTYTFYLLDSGRVVGFEPALCANDAEAMGRAREVLGRASSCDAVDVYFGEDRLFGVARPD